MRSKATDLSFQKSYLVGCESVCTLKAVSWRNQWPLHQNDRFLHVFCKVLTFRARQWHQKMRLVKLRWVHSISACVNAQERQKKLPVDAFSKISSLRTPLSANPCASLVENIPKDAPCCGESFAPVFVQNRAREAKIHGRIRRFCAPLTHLHHLFHSISATRTNFDLPITPSGPSFSRGHCVLICKERNALY
jgi:hypothetical protein